VIVLESAARVERRTDPFATTTPGSIPGRPRLLSYVGRWGRARRWLPADAARVLDVGCAFGYGSAAVLARGREGRVIVGVERDPELLARAQREFPWLPMIDADATELPIANSCADAVLLLEVIEHVAEPERVLAEAHRVLRPGGVIIISVPHRGPSRGLDALNVYAALHRRRPSWPTLEEGVVATDDGHHRHFSAAELGGLLDSRFTVDRVSRTGVGLQELVHLCILMLRVPLRAPTAARVVGPLHLIAYILDDLIPTGSFAYHLAVRAHSNKPGGEPLEASESTSALGPRQADGSGAAARQDDLEGKLS
jgi:SAM-dependent methyltransferase